MSPFNYPHVSSNAGKSKECEEIVNNSNGGQLQFTSADPVITGSNHEDQQVITVDEVKRAIVEMFNIVYKNTGNLPKISQESLDVVINVVKDHQRNNI